MQLSIEGTKENGMQHGRATSALAARRLVGRSRTMSLLMALCLFAAIALAIPGGWEWIGLESR